MSDKIREFGGVTKLKNNRDPDAGSDIKQEVR